MQKNADIRVGDKDAEVKVQKVLSQEPKEYWLISGHVGWRSDRKVFVLQNRIISKNGGLRKIKPPQWLNDRQRSVLSREGDLDKWRSGIAAVAQYSSRMMLAMSAAWAAPLLEIVKLQPFAINLFGLSKSGKTTALIASASIIGIGTESQLPNWNATDPAFQETARLFNDAIVPANELNLVKGPKKDRYARIRQLTYTFSEGREIDRSGGLAYAVPASCAMWRGILLSTAECSFEALALKAGELRDAGELARAHDVPAVGGKRTTIFDRRPTEVPKTQFRRWARKQLVAVRGACEKNYGWAIDPVILKIIELGKDAEPYVRKLVEEFRAALPTQPAEGAIRHAAENFGLIFAGGCIAIDAGVAPWDRESLKSAIVSCFEGFLAEVHRRDSIADDTKKILRDKVKELELPLKKEGVDLKSVPKIGFRRRVSNRVRYVINSKVFASWFPDSKHEMAALMWLDRTGKLHKTRNAGAPTEANKNWAVRFVKWSSSKGMRVIEFDSLTS